MATFLLWVQPNLAFDLDLRVANETTETKPYTVGTFRLHHGAVEPTLAEEPFQKPAIDCHLLTFSKAK
jgi:hypothetical protein